MKKLNLLLILSIFFFSCEKDNDLNVLEANIEPTAETTLAKKQTNCDIIGTTSVTPNGIARFTYTTDINNPIITWRSLSSNITLISGQGTRTATFRFSNSFANGLIRAEGKNGLLICSDILYIKSSNTCTNKKPDLLVLSPQWNAQGETCPNTTIELNATSNEPGITRYEWKIGGATILRKNTKGDIIIVRTSSSSYINLDFQVRSISSICGTSGWTRVTGRSINCNSSPNPPGGGGVDPL